MRGGPRHSQDKLLKFIRAHVETHGGSPSFSEMQAHLGLASKSGIARLIEMLERCGLIRRRERRANGIELLQTEDYHLPNCGCDRCARASYLGQLKLIQAIQAPAKLPRGIRLNGLRELSDTDRKAWRRAEKATATKDAPASMRSAG